MILLDGAPVASLEDYVERGGGAALGIAVESGPDHVLDELESSGLRGRGGAGFSTAAEVALDRRWRWLSTVPAIVANGGEWYRGFGTAESPGTMVCTVSGDTVRHGVGEFELGTPLATVDRGVGRWNWRWSSSRQIRAVGDLESGAPR